MPGHYVMIAVTDTGTGIPAEIRDKVFEPFFTTKEVGKGTGLGLSMVYGFVKQSGGHIKIYSEDGHGTTIKMYLPRAPSAGAQTAQDATPAARAAATKRSWWSRTIRWCATMSSTQLASLGYTTLEAGNGEEALRDDRRHGGGIDLLFTDVVMPGGMNGRELADEVAKLRPRSRCCSPRATPRTPSCITAGSIRACCCSASPTERRIWRAWCATRWIDASRCVLRRNSARAAHRGQHDQA